MNEMHKKIVEGFESSLSVALGTDSFSITELTTGELGTSGSVRSKSSL